MTFVGEQTLLPVTENQGSLNPPTSDLGKQIKIAKGWNQRNKNR